MRRLSCAMVHLKGFIMGIIRKLSYMLAIVAIAIGFGFAPAQSQPVQAHDVELHESIDGLLPGHSGSNTAETSDGEGTYDEASGWVRDTLRRLGDGEQELPVIFMVLVALAAMLLGSLHALTPGHGKSFMAALLIGKNRAQNKDVFIVASAITLAHTAVIYLIGFLLLVLQATISLPEIVRFFEVVSALIVLGLGLFLLTRGVRGVLHARAHASGKGHEHHHHHIHAKPRNIDSAKGLFMAGVGGGIVPCIDALSLLIIAASVQAVGLGLFIVFCFSLGLAMTIVVIGLSVIHTKKALKVEEKIGQKVALYAPLVTGSSILILGLILLSGRGL